MMADNSHSFSKFAAVGFHTALTLELEALEKNGIKTSCLCPVFVNARFTKTQAQGEVKMKLEWDDSMGK